MRGREKRATKREREKSNEREREPLPRLVAAPVVHGSDERTRILAMAAMVRSR